MKDFLQSLLNERQEELKTLQERSQASENIDEVRSIGEQIDKVTRSINSIKNQMDKLVRTKNVSMNDGEFSPLASYGLSNANMKRKKQDGTNSMEYRQAFMENVLYNVPIPDEFRANESTLTSDVSSVIPTQLVNQIIEKMDECGMILSLVTRTSYAAGVVIPTSTVKPVASWVGEGSTSDKQKKTTGKVSFAYFKLRCEISMSMEVGIMALSAFEAKFVENVSKAMTIAIEKAIIAGDGTSQPKGILTEEGTSITIASTIPTYKELVAIEATVPAGYEATAKWFMTKAQFANFLSMVDGNGQPIARVNYGIGGKPERILLGREVVIHPYSSEMGSVVAGIVDFGDYVLNTIYDMGISKKQDWDTEDMLTKAVMSVDGKMIDADSLIKVVVKA